MTKRRTVVTHDDPDEHKYHDEIFDSEESGFGDRLMAGIKSGQGLPKTLTSENRCETDRGLHFLCRAWIGVHILTVLLVAASSILELSRRGSVRNQITRLLARIAELMWGLLLLFISLHFCYNCNGLEGYGAESVLVAVTVFVVFLFSMLMSVAFDNDRSKFWKYFAYDSYKMLTLSDTVLDKFVEREK